MVLCLKTSPPGATTTAESGVDTGRTAIWQFKKVRLLDELLAALTQAKEYKQGAETAFYFDVYDLLAGFIQKLGACHAEADGLREQDEYVFGVTYCR